AKYNNMIRSLITPFESRSDGRIDFAHNGQFIIASQAWPRQLFLGDLRRSEAQMRDELDRATSEELRRRTCKLVGRNFTKEEWDHYVGGSQVNTCSNLTAK